VKALALALLAIVFAGGTDEEVVQRDHVRFAGGDLFAASCHDAVASAPDPGLATIGFQFEITGGRRVANARYTGTVTFSLDEAVVTMPKSIAWPHMTGADRERAEMLRRAIYHHEIGHIRVAEAVRDDLNRHEPLTASDPVALQNAADTLGRAGFDRFKREEREYDALTDHGRKQHTAPGPLAGPDTIIICR
jgi:predicted secreted Zn-dependent protease